MPQYYTLEEAAKVLHLPPDELREKAKKKEVRAFQDRGNWRFLAQQIDELARQQGLESDPALQLADGGKKPAPKADDDRVAVDFSLDDDAVPLGKEKPSDKSGPKSTRSGPKSPNKPSGDSDVRLVMDGGVDFQIDLDSDVKVEPSGPKSSGARPSGPKSSGTRPKGGSKSKVVADSGPQLVESALESGVNPKRPKAASDSDIRLDNPSGSSSRKRGPDANIITEEIDLDAEEAKAATKAPAPKPKPLTKHAPQLPTSSPFELSEPDIDISGPASKGPKTPPKGNKKDEKDSSSDFELIPFGQPPKSGELLGSGEIPLLGSDEDALGDLPAPNAGNSGINLQDPADSGISLESGGSDEIEFELSLDSASTPKPTSASGKKSKSKVEKPDADSSSEFELSLDEAPSDASDSEFELSLDESSEDVGLKKVDDASSSEFELTLDDEGSLAGGEGEGDIFEETDFNVPALEDDESGSQAVAIDESDTDLESSDFDISLDEGGEAGEESDSQVVALDEEEADDAAATVARPRKAKAKSKLQTGAISDDEAELEVEEAEGSGRRTKTAPAEDEEDEEELVSAGAAPPAEWGPLPAIVLFPTVLVMFVVGIMGFEIIQGMWGYHRATKVGKPIIDTIARSIDDTLPKE
jgi:hypothetical protein